MALQFGDSPHHFDLNLLPFTLEAGARLTEHRVRGWTWGPPRPAPVVVLIHALTGFAQAGSEDGWWEGVVGPGKALDPTSLRLLCFNNLGSCYGTTGPADDGFPTMQQDCRFERPQPVGKGAFTLDEALLPATITSWDQARSILMALDQLEVDKVLLTTGGSLGGMIALCLGALAPTRFEALCVFGASDRCSPWQLGFNHIGRQAILLDPGFPHNVTRGLELARQVGHMTYRAEPGLQLTQGRSKARDAGLQEGLEEWSPRSGYAVQTYLEHQGRKLRGRFDARAYLAQLAAMDHHDLQRVPPGPDSAESWSRFTGNPLERIQGCVTLVAIDSDQLFGPQSMWTLAEALCHQGVATLRETLNSPHGHDAFLIEFSQVDDVLSRTLDMAAANRKKRGAK